MGNELNNIDRIMGQAFGDEYWQYKYRLSMQNNDEEGIKNAKNQLSDSFYLQNYFDFNKQAKDITEGKDNQIQTKSDNINLSNRDLYNEHNLYDNNDLIENPQKYYMWYSRDDKDMFPNHSLRQGQVYQWSNPPVGGNPGDHKDCRCLAVKYNPFNNPVLQEKILRRKLADAYNVYDNDRRSYQKKYKILSDDLQRQQQMRNNIVSYINSNRSTLDGIKGAYESAGDIANIAEMATRSNGLGLINILAGGLAGDLAVGWEGVRSIPKYYRDLFRLWRQEKLYKKSREMQNSYIENLEKQLKELEAANSLEKTQNNR